MYIFATQRRRPWIFQTMNSARLYNLSLKFQWLMSSGLKNTGLQSLSLWQRLNYFLNDPFSDKMNYIFNIVNLGEIMCHHSGNPDGFPILLLHSCPSSFQEFRSQSEYFLFTSMLVSLDSMQCHKNNLKVIFDFWQKSQKKKEFNVLFYILKTVLPCSR